MHMSMEGLASLVMALAAFLTAVGSIRRQDRRPDDNDQARAYKALRKVATRAEKHRAAYDADASELLRLHAVATSADVPLPVPDVEGLIDPARAAHDQRVLEQMAGYAERMESAARTFNAAVDRSGAQLGRAVTRLTTGQQQAVPPRTTRLPPPGARDPHDDPAR